MFGPAARYPYGTGLRYPPPLAPLAEYLALARQLGFERFVFVQRSAYGQDNACMPDAMREVGANCRGIVDVDENVPAAQLSELHAVGVRGVRINVSPVKARETGFAERLPPRILRLDARCAEIGWQLDFLLPGWLTQGLMATLRELKSQFTQRGGSVIEPSDRRASLRPYRLRPAYCSSREGRRALPDG